MNSNCCGGSIFRLMEIGALSRDCRTTIVIKLITMRAVLLIFYAVTQVLCSVSHAGLRSKELSQSSPALLVTALGRTSETLELKEFQVSPLHSDKHDVTYDDYGGRGRDPFQRGIGRPPRPRCHLSTLTKLQLVTVTVVVHTPLNSKIYYIIFVELFGCGQ